ncbi:riboflavin biosynthesis protein RibF [Chondromyces crocatus]|uniref:Riboflavin biosynthesis protein n=1 Tax=Chondromyces crocatus TaxID=52 RepID=A0A0K1EPG1_CHOCO|nr:riboflavin biosynthesis protein RibF [Chondromyces crocatus]
MVTGSLVVIGNFDGVHRGHQALFADAVTEAERRGLRPMALTFAPHPALALGRTPPAMLTTSPRKTELIQRHSPALQVAVERFDEAFSKLTPEDFARTVLAQRLRAAVVVVGDNFRFGHRRAGDLRELARLGERFGFEANSHALVGDEGGTWSSTRIREEIAKGALDEAARMLSRPHMVTGRVVQGDRRGRTIGFPTCNLAEVMEALPPFGVYATLVDRVSADGHAAVLAGGVANLGRRPTVKDPAAPPTLEVHLFDHDEDLYGCQLRVHLIARLRPEKRFSGLDELRAQIAADATAARQVLEAWTPDPAAGGAWR